MFNITVENLSVSFGTVDAVRDVSFSAGAGEITVLLGPNGAGKTTSIDCIAGNRSPDAGQILVGDIDPARQRSALHNVLGIMLQEGGIYPAIKPPEAIELFASYYRHHCNPSDLLERVGLNERASTPYRNLSGGEKQRLSLALAIVGEPAVAVLDEPTSGIDPHGTQDIRALISELRTSGTTVLLTTHDLTEAEALADRIVIIDDGQLVADGRPDELLGKRLEFSFRGTPNLDLSSLSTHLGCEVFATQPGTYSVHAEPTPQRIVALTTWMANQGELVDDIQGGRLRLDEVFAKLTDKEHVT